MLHKMGIFRFKPSNSLGRILKETLMEEGGGKGMSSKPVLQGTAGTFWAG